MAKLPPQPTGVPPGSAYWNDWYEKLRTLVDEATAATGTGLTVRQNLPTINDIILNGPIVIDSITAISTTVVLAKITGGGIDGSLTFTHGLLTSKVDPS